MFLGAISLFLTFLYLFILGFYSYGWFKSKSSGLKITATEKLPQISIIVPARNEAENIKNCIYSLKAQCYPEKLFEIIVVDDESEDKTDEIVLQLTAEVQNLRLLRSSENPSSTATSKKRALETGIAAASGELIVCTDADCTHSELWLFSLADGWQQGQKKFIAAPVVLQTDKTLLSIFQTLDFLTLQGITAASVATGFHTMCNGANIAYSREAFYEAGGFKGIDNLPTGDDMLLMHKIYKKHPAGIAYIRHSDAVVVTKAAQDWYAFFNQRIRWASKAAFFDDKRIFWVLLLVYLLNLWLIVLAIGSLFSNYLLYNLIGVLLSKTIIEMAFLLPVATFFKKQKLMWFFPLLQPIHILYTVAAGWLGRFGSYQWKGRTIRHNS